MNNDELILSWVQSVSDLDAAKKRESELRKKVIDGNFPNNPEGPISGTQTVDLGNGYKIKAEFKLNYRLENKNQELDKALDAIVNTFEEGDYVARNLVKWKPELSMTEYKKLPNEIKSVIDEALVVTQGLPSLKFIQPKE